MGTVPFHPLPPPPHSQPCSLWSRMCPLPPPFLPYQRMAAMFFGCCSWNILHVVCHTFCVQWDVLFISAARSCAGIQLSAFHRKGWCDVDIIKETEATVCVHHACCIHCCVKVVLPIQIYITSQRRAIQFNTVLVCFANLFLVDHWNGNSGSLHEGCRFIRLPKRLPYHRPELMPEVVV